MTVTEFPAVVKPAPSRRIEKYLERCEAAVSGQHGHNSLFKVAVILVWGFALTVDEAWPYILQFNSRCLPPWSEYDLRRKLTQALTHKGHSKPRGYLLNEKVEQDLESFPLPRPEPAWPNPDLDRIDGIVSSGPGVYDLWEQSPHRFDDSDNHVEEIIDCLLPGDPLLCIGKTNQEFHTRRRETWRSHLARFSLMVPGPMLAISGQTQEGRESEHTKQATARKIYQVIEFDFSETDKNGNETIWARLIRKWRGSGTEIIDACASLLLHLRGQLPTLACVTFSGGKSLHAWFRVFELTEAEQKKFMREAVSLGPDWATFTRSQFVRIPDGLRTNGKRQTCFYLDPREAVKA